MQRLHLMEGRSRGEVSQSRVLGDQVGVHLEVVVATI